MSGTRSSSTKTRDKENGAAGRLFEHDASAFHGHSLEFEKPKVAEHAHRVGCEAQLLPQELHKTINALYSLSGRSVHVPGNSYHKLIDLVF